MSDPTFYLALCYGVGFVVLSGTLIYLFLERAKYRALAETTEEKK